MSDSAKYGVIKSLMFLSFLFGFLFILLSIYFLLTQISTEIVSFCLLVFGIILIIAALGLQGPRNKYRDIVEYDENGISRRYGDFSSLSNQERKNIEKAKLLQRELLISSATLKTITKDGDLTPEESLNQLIGLNDTKKQISKMSARMEYDFSSLSPKERRRILKGKATLPEAFGHMCFIGPPGTGKTTCAKIMTGFLYKYHYIKRNKYIEVDGNFFNSNTPGEVTQKMEYIIGQASGGVLFIDEAYALLNSHSGQEAIATLIKKMEDNRDKLIVIFAGYEKEMKEFIASNSGLASRIKHWVYFCSYNSDELWQIFVKMANDANFKVSESAQEPFFNIILQEIKTNPSYGNARTVRNILEKVIDEHAFNLKYGKIFPANNFTIVAEDFSDFSIGNKIFKSS